MSFAFVRIILAAALLPLAVGSAQAQSAVERGKYLVTVMDCGGCHTTGALRGQRDPAKFLAGNNIGWLVPGQGVFYPANLTPDAATGIGTWTAADIVKLLRTGAEPSGRIVVKVMPWEAYSHLTDADVGAIAAYLKTIPAVSQAVSGPVAADQVKTPYLTMAMPHPP